MGGCAQSGCAARWQRRRSEGVGRRWARRPRHNRRHTPPRAGKSPPDAAGMSCAAGRKRQRGHRQRGEGWAVGGIGGEAASGRPTTSATAISPTSARAGAASRGHRPPGIGANDVCGAMVTSVGGRTKATHATTAASQRRQQGGPNTRPRASNCTGHRPMHPNCTPTPPSCGSSHPPLHVSCSSACTCASWDVDMTAHAADTGVLPGCSAL